MNERTSKTSLNLPKIDNGLLHDRVVEVVRERILSGEFPPGMSLSIAGLADELGVSRSPVASALQRLAAEGYVVIRSRRGTVVTDFDTDNFLQGLEVRLALEQFAAPFCIANVTEEDIVELEGLQRRIDTEFPTWDAVFDGLAERQGLARQFHQKVMALSGNEPLQETYRFAYDRVHRIGAGMSAARARARSATARSKRGPTIDEHHQMIAALRNRDVEALRAAFAAEVARVRAETLQSQHPGVPTDRLPSLND